MSSSAGFWTKRRSLSKEAAKVAARFRQAWPNDRRVEVYASGKWYVLLTIAVGVVGLTSGNNVLYLIETFLLGGLIVSGLVSEHAVTRADISMRRASVSAGQPSRDRISVRNRSRIPIFCLRILEWQQGDQAPVTLAFVPFLKANGSVELESFQTFSRRGEHSWRGLAIACSFPFGFANKVKIFDEPGDRLVWPEKVADQWSRQDAYSVHRPGASEHAEGEVREMAPEDDFRHVVWARSQGPDEWMVRSRRALSGDYSAMLDLRAHPGESFERTIVEVASKAYRQPADDTHSTLTILSEKGRRVVRGRNTILDALARARAEGPTP